MRLKRRGRAHVGARALATGIGAALRTPLWLRGGRAARLMAAARPAEGEGPVASGARDSEMGAHPDADGALRATRAALRLLARLPGPAWRNSCLYRSVAGCLALRALGIPARLRLGVRSTPSRADASIEAHAWIDAPGVRPDVVTGGAERDDPGAYVELRRPAASVEDEAAGPSVGAAASGREAR